MNRIWNGRLSGLLKALFILTRIVYLNFYEKINTFFWRFNLGKCGKNVIIQKGTIIRFPGNVTIKDSVAIGRSCILDSEFNDSNLVIDRGSQVNKSVSVDFSGDIYIGKNVVISENVSILSHDHGYDPHSNPKRISKRIEDNVWIGSYAKILPKVEIIGKNSIIASGAVVTKNVPDNSIVGGNPAKFILKIDK